MFVENIDFFESKSPQVRRQDLRQHACDLIRLDFN
jgi:hypothetical protein